MSWSLKNSTLYFNSNELISDISAGSREATPKLTLLSSAPMLQVRGSTRIEFCSAAADTSAGAGWFGFTFARAIGFLRRAFWWTAFKTALRCGNQKLLQTRQLGLAKWDRGFNFLGQMGPARSIR